MNERLKRIEEELADELTRVEASLAEFEGRRETLLAERDRVAATLAGLRGASAPTTPSAKRGVNRQPCVTKAEVAELVTRVLQQNGPCAEEDLIDLVEDALKAAGRSRSGFKLRYQGVRRELLTTTDDGRLALAGASLNPTRRTA
jgi:hypothetical protein